MARLDKFGMLALLTCAVGGGGACSAPDSDRQEQPQGAQYQLAATTVRVLGFESPADWAVVQGSIPAPVKSLDHSEGTASLQVAARNFVALRSIKLATLGAEVGDTASWDIKLPTQQPNPNWGATQLYAEIPSLGLYSAYIGQVELTGLPLGQWQTVSVRIPSNILEKLRGQYTDLVVTVVLNVPYNATAPYLLDNLRFGGNSAVCLAPIAECVVKRPDGEPIQAVFGYRSCLSTSGTSVPIGTDNQFRPGNANRGQPTQFQAGRRRAQFLVNFDGDLLVWKLGKNETVASRTLPECTPECVANLFDPNASPPAPGTVVAPPSPLSTDESLNIRRAFKWSETTPVPEYRVADGTPLLYQAIIYLANRGDHDLLDAMRIHYDSFPIFGEERDRLSQLGAPHAYSHDGSGQFVFAILPGTLYNAIRSAALDPTEPDEMFPALQLRDIPAPGARASCGLRPVAECVVDRGSGNFTAIFGYNNPAGGVVTIPSGSDNLLSSNPTIATKPEVFANGVQQRVFATDFRSGASVRWTLNGLTVTANTGSVRCPASVLSTVGGERVPVPKHLADLGDFECRPPTPNEVAYPQSKLPPAARENTCASVNYDYLGTYGFKWRGLEPYEADVKAMEAEIRLGLLPDPPSVPGAAKLQARRFYSDVEVSRKAFSFGGFVRTCVKKVASGVKGTIDLVAQGLTQVARLFVGSRTVTVEIVLKNTDADLTPAAGPTDMVQAWGNDSNGFGQALKLKGVGVRAAKTVFLSKGDLGDDNKASVRVLNHVGADICFTISNDAAQLISGWFIPHEVCNFIPPNGGEYHIGDDGRSTYTIDVQAAYMNVLAQLTDGKKYMKDVAQFGNLQAEVIAGTIANTIGGTFTANRAFAPCLGLNGGVLSVYDIALAMGSQIGEKPGNWVLGELSGKVKMETGAAGRVQAKIQSAQDSMVAVTAEIAAQFPGQNVETRANAAQTATQDANTAAARFLADMQAFDRAQQAATVAKKAADAAVGKPDETAKKAVAHTAAGDLTTAATAARTSGTDALTRVTTAWTRFGELYTAMTGLPISQAVTQGVGSAYQNVTDAKGILQDSADGFAEVVSKATEVVTTIVSDVVLFALVGIVGEVFEFLAAGDIILPEVVPSICVANLTPPTRSVCPAGKNTRADCPPPSGQCYQANDIAGFPTGIMQLDPAPRHRNAVRGRGVATHEYGHYTLCNLMVQTWGESLFKSAYGECAAGAITHKDDPTFQPLYINEGFADFFTSEVVGGTNYPKLVPSRPDAPTGGVNYCTDAAHSCFEDNIGAPGSAYTYNPASPALPDEVARIVTTLHDVFDNWGYPNFPGRSYPTQVTSWNHVAPSTVGFSGTLEGSEDDEMVSLPGSGWRDIVKNMAGFSITQDKLMQGINVTMREADYNWCQRCEVFRLHTPSATCPSAWMDARPSGMECEWENCVPPKTVYHGSRLCGPTCAAGYTFDPAQLICVPIYNPP